MFPIPVVRCSKIRPPPQSLKSCMNPCLPQDAVLELASDALLGKYFRSIFKLLSSGDTTLVTFSTGCLLRSRSCWEAWSRLGPTSPSTTTALLKELSSGKVAPPPLPMSEVTAILNKLASANEKNKEMAKVRTYIIMCVAVDVVTGLAQCS